MRRRITPLDTVMIYQPIALHSAHQAEIIARELTIPEFAALFPQAFNQAVHEIRKILPDDTVPMDPETGTHPQEA